MLANTKSLHHAGEMTAPESPSGITIQLHVDDIDRARRFYGAIFGGEPHYQPHDDFLEWRVGDGETWLQVVGSRGDQRPLPNRVRFRVEDIQAAHAAVLAAAIEASAVRTLPGVVRFFDFSDPWGNRLGYYQDLAPSGQQPVIGGSAHDEALFEEG